MIALFPFLLIAPGWSVAQAAGGEARSAQPSPGDGLLPIQPLPRPAVGSWAVFRVLQHGRQTDVTLRITGVRGGAVRLERLAVAPGVWQEQELLLSVWGDGWQALPRLLLQLAGQTAHQLPLDGLSIRPPGPAAERAAGPVRLEACWRGRDPALGELHVRRRATLEVRPRLQPLGLVRAEILTTLRLPGDSLEERVVVTRLRQGSARGWRRELKRYEAAPARSDKERAGRRSGRRGKRR